MHTSRTWLALALGDDRSHASNDGYADEITSSYRWDSTVPRHAEVRAGDRIVLWNGTELLGMSIIEQIEWASGVTKQVYRCPSCGLSEIKKRKDGSYRCSARPETDDHPATFRTPAVRTLSVTTYATDHGRQWQDLRGVLTASELRDCCEAPRSQHSFRLLRWSAVEALLAARGHRPIAPEETGAGAALPDLPAGHRIALTLQRRGQDRFRARLLAQFGEVCAVTGPAPSAALEACHLYSYASEGAHHDHGGLMLRRDIHRLFDAGLITIEPDAQVVQVSPALEVYPVYRDLQGRPLQVTLTPGQLRWVARHWRQHGPAAPAPAP